MIVGHRGAAGPADPAGAAHPTLGAYKWAFAVQYLLWGLGAAQVWRYRRTTRRIMLPEHLAAIRRGEAIPAVS